MKNLTLIVIVFLSLAAYSQNDLIVINEDTITCKILENSLDWVSYVSNGTEYRASTNQLTIINGTSFASTSTPLTITGIRFQVNKPLDYTTQDVMRKIDFSVSGPHFKWGKDFVTKAFYITGLDTSYNKLFWFGLDFSWTTIQLGNATRADYSHSFFRDCNDFFLIDKNFKDFIKSFNFATDTGCVMSRNNSINLINAYNKRSKSLQLDSIRAILSGFRSMNHGIGLVIFITEIDKIAETETFYITFFDIKSKTLLLCLKETSQTGGIGMSWHWTRSINDYLGRLLKGGKWRDRYLVKE